MTNEKDLDDTRVNIVRCQTYRENEVREALEQLWEPWGGIGMLGKARTALVKPNLLTVAAPVNAVTTHPSVVKSQVLMLQKHEIKPVIGDSPATLSHEKIKKISGLGKIARETGVPFIIPTEIRYKEFHGRIRRNLPLASLVQEVDSVINMPKLKTHSLTGISGAVKNLFGCIVGFRKQRYHLENPFLDDFSHLLLDICLSVAPAFTVMDAVIGMEGPGPRSGRPKKIGLLIGGKNAVAVDRVAVELLGFGPDEVSTIRVARRRGIRGSRLRQIEIIGERPDRVRVADFDRGPGRGGLALLAGRFSLGWMQNMFHRFRPVPRICPRQCTGCGECARGCPLELITLEEGLAKLERSRCIRCYCCQEVCPHGAIILN